MDVEDIARAGKEACMCDKQGLARGLRQIRMPEEMEREGHERMQPPKMRMDKVENSQSR